MCLGIPGQIVEIADAGEQLAVVNVGGLRRKVNIAFILEGCAPPESCLGAWVLVHVGFAMSRIDEGEAASILAMLEELGELDGEREAMRASAGIEGDAASS